MYKSSLPTRGQAILDKILSNLQDQYSKPQISSAIGLSDHSTVLWYPLQKSDKHSNARRPIGHPIKDSDLRAFGRWITNYAWDEVNNAVSPYSKATFYQTLHNAIHLFFPIKSVTSHINDKPWITQELKYLIANRQQAFSNNKLHLWRLPRNKISRSIEQSKHSFYNH